MKNAKRILFAITQSEWGGAQSYVLKTAMEARGRGFEVLVAAGGEDELKQRCLEEKIDYRRLRHMRRDISVISDVRAIAELISLFRLWMPSTIYLHSSKAGIVGSIAARLANARRVVYRIGGWSFLDPVSPLRKSIRLWSEKLTARFKDIIIVLHPDDEALAKRHGIIPKERLMMIQNGLDLPSFEWKLLCKKLARARLQSLWARGRVNGENDVAHSPDSDDSVLVLTIANFFPTKDLLGYLDAVATVHEAHPTARFLIAGDGDEREALEAKRHALGLDDVVSFPGFVNDASTLLSGADMFVLPSAKEGMPWSLLEAMAARVPCIATDVGANAWMIGKNGWIVPPKHPDLLSEALVKAIQNPSEANRRAEEARKDVELRFTERAMFEKTFQLFQ